MTRLKGRKHKSLIRVFSIIAFLLLIISSCQSNYTVTKMPKLRNSDYTVDANTPYSPTSSISFTIDDSSEVKIEIHNVIGELMQIPLDSILGPEAYTLELRNLDSLESGIYFYKIIYVGIPSGDTTVVTNKMLLLK